MDQNMKNLIYAFKRELRSSTYLDQWMYREFFNLYERIFVEDLFEKIDDKLGYLESELEKRGGE